VVCPEEFHFALNISWTRFDECVWQSSEDKCSEVKFFILSPDTKLDSGSSFIPLKVRWGKITFFQKSNEFEMQLRSI